MNRRHFLRTGLAAAPALTLAGRLFAAPASSPRFLCVFLRGGYDCANFLIPWSSNFYYDSRPKIAIAKPDPAILDGALALDSDWALAPAARDSLGQLYQQRQALFVPFAGTDDLSRSHFETQDSIELGQPVQGQRDFGSGFLARLATTLTGATPIAFTDSLPLAFKGDAGIASMSMQRVGKSPFDDTQTATLRGMYVGSHLESAVTEGLELQQQMAQAMQEEMQAANRGAITTKGFELTAERMARLMRTQYRLGFVDVGGWDTHVNEGGARGALATNLTSLSVGLATFAQSLGDEWNNTVVFVLSEFGRTFRENGNAGTDHGHGSVYWVLGGRINGGRIAGAQVRVAKDTLFQNRDYPVLNDYRSVLAGIFGGMWGLSPQQLQVIFPGAPPLDLQVI
ncbi:MAG TPA: DUF1501 domain-containing protein [Steroidobacteraceae bacterium]|jgi:uncharacterized protein (DUF1501 family)|nr:DUF1501 domain-containing protein [Steroidobacteraceae bacterium]